MREEIAFGRCGSSENDLFEEVRKEISRLRDLLEYENPRRLTRVPEHLEKRRK